MANRRELVLAIVSDATTYRKGLKQAETQTRTFGKQVGRTADQGVGKLNSRMSAVSASFGSIGALAAGAAIGKFASDAVRDASNLQESINAVNVVFGEAAEGIHAIGEESADSFGLSQRAFNEFATRFSAFAEQIADRDGRSVVEVVDEMTARIADFASVHNLSLERAAQVAQSTLAGETEVFRRFGGDVSAAAVEAKVLEEGIVESGEAISEQDKILGRYMLFMEQTADTAGDFKNTQDDMANASRTFTAALEDARAEIGEELLPVMADLLETGQDLIPVLVKVAEFVGVVARGAALAAAGSDIERIAIASGGAADSATTLATAILELDRAGKGGRGPQHMRQQYEDLIDTWDGGSTEIQGLLDGLDFLVEEMGLTGKEAEILEEILRDKLANSLTDAEVAARAAFEGTEEYDSGLTDAEQSARDFYNTSEELGGQLDLQGGKWDDVVTSMENYEDMIRRLTDPVFAAIDNQQKLDEATQNYLDTAADPEASASDLEQAMLDLVEAQIAADESARDLPDSLQEAADHIAILGDRAGITDEDLKTLRETIMSFDGLSAQSTIGINVVGGERIEGIDINRDVSLRQHGGPVRRGSPYIVGEAGPEMFWPSQNGVITSNSDMDRIHTAMRGGGTETLGMSGGGTTYNIFTLSWGDFVQKAHQAGIEVERFGWS